MTRDDLRDLAMAHGYFIIPIRPGVTITWTDEETGEIHGRASIKGKNVLPFPSTSKPAADRTEHEGETHGPA